MSKTNKKSLFGRFQNLAIAKRITLIYGGIFSFSLLLLSGFFFVNTTILEQNSVRKQLETTIVNIERFLDNGGTLTDESLKNLLDNKYEMCIRDRPVESQSVSVKKEAPAERKAEKKLLKMSYKDQREYDSIGEEIAALEDKIAALESEMAACTTDYMRLQELSDEKTATEEKLEERMERWMELSELAEDCLLYTSFLWQTAYVG